MSWEEKSKLKGNYSPLLLMGLNYLLQCELGSSDYLNKCFVKLLIILTLSVECSNVLTSAMFSFCLGQATWSQS